MNPLPLLTDPGPLLAAVGVLGLLGAVLAETGLLIGFFLPGDSLLFTAGLLAGKAGGFAPLWVVCVLTPVAAFVGDHVGYSIGRRVGPGILKGRAVRRIGPGAVVRAERFFAEHGPKAVLLARFVPVVRTVAPTMAGVAAMNRSTFTVFNAMGALAWGMGMPLLGAALGGVGFVRAHIDLIILAMVVLSLLPVMGHVIALRRGGRAGVQRTAAGPAAEAGDL